MVPRLIEAPISHNEMRENIYMNNEYYRSLGVMMLVDDEGIPQVFQK